MWRIAFLSLTLALGGCGYKTWWNPPFTGGYSPNRPVGDSANMRRVLGDNTPAEPLLTEPGDIWPGPLPPAPTLKDLEMTGGLAPQPEAPTTGSPLRRNNEAPRPPPAPSPGSSTPPGNAQPGLATPQPAPPLSSYAAPPNVPRPSGPGGPVLQTPSGPNVVTGGGPGYQTTIGPGGGQSIVVPNGNGTSTVIHADGRIETVPTPK